MLICKMDSSWDNLRVQSKHYQIRMRLTLLTLMLSSRSYKSISRNSKTRSNRTSSHKITSKCSWSSTSWTKTENPITMAATHQMRTLRKGRENEIKSRPRRSHLILGCKGIRPSIYLRCRFRIARGKHTIQQATPNRTMWTIHMIRKNDACIQHLISKIKLFIQVVIGLYR